MPSISDKADKIRIFRRSMEMLFSVPSPDGSLVLPDDELLKLLNGLFDSLEHLNPASPADYANTIARKFENRPLPEELSLRLFDRMIAFHVLPEELTDMTKWSDDLRFLLEKSWNLFYALGHFRALAGDEALGEMMPGTLRAFDRFAEFAAERQCRAESLRKLAAFIADRDAFRFFRTFRCCGGSFLPVRPDSVKGIDRFFGFNSVRAIFKDHFSRFSQGKSNLPLLIYSLPGYGKTSMVMSYALAHENLTLLLADPGDLEHGWNDLISRLAARPDRKFVLFFDDIDPDKVDWYSFRTNVGGAFSPPPNVLVVVTANYEFPTNVLSRGRKVSFPTFDEIRCMEMVEEFLFANGMKHPTSNLINLISADYTEEFGQKKFTELSPRSLTRYLKIYETDRIKRRTMVELSFGQLITKPDAQLFYEFNIDLMRSLYGDGYIEKLLKEKLKHLEEN